MAENEEKTKPESPVHGIGMMMPKTFDFDISADGSVRQWQTSQQYPGAMVYTTTKLNCGDQLLSAAESSPTYKLLGHTKSGSYETALVPSDGASPKNTRSNNLVTALLHERALMVAAGVLPTEELVSPTPPKCAPLTPDQITKLRTQKGPGKV